MVVACLAPIAAWILVSGLDDLFITLVHLFTCHRRFAWPGEEALGRTPERPIAILVPLWHEHRVIARMLATNLASIRYRNFHIFAGVYPNDRLTLKAVASQARHHRNLHLAVCPHPGPTSKGDCLNWIWQNIRDYEIRHGIQFEVLMTHDAEDVIHPESLRLINWFSRHYAMVQIPVLALPTPLMELTHGLYCDEFAEYQTKDIPVRQHLGGFLPANGVGTGFTRDAVEAMADARGGRPFDPTCLTEDYETGFELHRMGFRQIFVPVRDPEPVATREYFPRRFRASISQRTRWVTGIVLQGWERHGWSGSWGRRYWFWRDRKGLIGNLLSPAANLLLFYGIARFSEIAAAMPGWLARSCEATLVIAMVQTGIRITSAAQIYSWRFAAGVPGRMLWGNVVNFAATAGALWEFWNARRNGKDLAWRKTEHMYPVPQAALRPAASSITTTWAAEPDPTLHRST